MQETDFRPITRLTLRQSLLATVASVDTETLVVCPKRDVGTVEAVAVIMIFTVFYQCALFAVVGNHLFGTPGRFEPAILGVSAFISLFIMRIDAFTIMRSGWHLNGIAELKRGGLDISGGIIERIKSGILLTFRVGLALGSAQLTAIFSCIFVFSADIDARIESDHAHANAALVAETTSRVDGEIQRRRDDIVGQKAEIEKSGAEIQILRKQENDLMSSEPQLRDAEAEIARLTENKSKIDDELQNAQTFALNEAAGIVGEANNSGKPGEGVRFRAASGRVANAKARQAEINASLEEARHRLDDLRKQFEARTDAERQDIERQIAATNASASGAKAQLASLTSDLARMINSRESTIETAVQASPDFILKRTGLLIQIAALRNLADGNPEIGIVILLIELTSFGLEFAAVLSKITSFVPTTYSTLLARDAYVSAVAVVDEMVQTINARRPPPLALEAPAETESEPEAQTDAANDNDPDFESPPTALNVENLDEEPIPPPEPPQPPKRPRGRPRKVPAE